jgi:hypothetical protein
VGAIAELVGEGDPDAQVAYVEPHDAGWDERLHGMSLSEWPGVVQVRRLRCDERIRGDFVSFDAG